MYNVTVGTDHEILNTREREGEGGRGKRRKTTGKRNGRKMFLF